jgi:NET1-associated nuclear protein 1 (U3 small nucleolar RNA-associated protein 17)
MVELRLDIRTEERPTLNLMQLADSAEETEGVEIGNAIDKSAAMRLNATEDDDGPAVVSQHQLTSIFDIGPSFTLPPIEELFYQVAGLFSSKPAIAHVS